ncbi:MAG: tetratricopeptide repeat protein [Acidobacteria bacterium]|nr:tetratricopeptide repeat protein [Acidobacteriota bacterium]
MQADDLLREGNPRAALASLQEAVRRDPASSAYRVFLFQLLALNGEWERAGTQLEVLAKMDPATSAMGIAYSAALNSEVLRAEIFAGRRTPLVFGEPEEWVAWLVQALKLDAEGKPRAAAELRARAFDAAPAVPGGVDGTPFNWIADGDSRLGPVLEAIVQGRYCWVPFPRIRELRTEKPADLRDLVWLPAEFTWANGGTAPALLPVRYVGSEASDDGLVQLARKTDWRRIDEDTYVGLGQRMLVTDEGEHPLLDVRAITFPAPPSGA